MMKKNSLPDGSFVRMCAGCGERYNKKEHSFLRVVRQSDGTVCVDSSGKTGGRGAYVCKNAVCVEKLRKSGRLSKLLRCEVPPEIYNSLEEEVDR